MRAPPDRFVEITRFEKRAKARGFCHIAGIDEAGRGPLAGPVVAAACILPEGLYFEGIDDSKKLTPARRQALYQAIIENKEIIYGISIVDAFIIDQINIFRATLQAMAGAIAALRLQPDYILVDGKHLPQTQIPGEAIIEGDCHSQSIMAAAILAKVTRDALMLEFHAQWPEYGFSSHKGYATEAHLTALKQFGPCPIHRMSFAPVKNHQMIFEFG